MAKAKEKQPKRRAIALGDTAIDRALPNDNLALSDGFSVNVNGLVVAGQPTFEQAVAVGRLLPVAERAIQFALGDYINFVEDRFGEQASQIIDYADGWSEKTCAVYSWLAKRIDPERRRMDRLTIRHHLAVAALSAALQTKWLTKAVADDEDKPWTVQRLLTAMRDTAELPETFWLLVAAESEADQTALQEQLEASGRSCKAMVRRKRSTL